MKNKRHGIFHPCLMLSTSEYLNLRNLKIVKGHKTRTESANLIRTTIVKNMRNSRLGNGIEPTTLVRLIHTNSPKDRLHRIGLPRTRGFVAVSNNLTGIRIITGLITQFYFLLCLFCLC